VRISTGFYENGKVIGRDRSEALGDVEEEAGSTDEQRLKRRARGKRDMATIGGGESQILIHAVLLVGESERGRCDRPVHMDLSR
jgi:hypothetical protein